MNLKLILQGFVVGVGKIIPGVSGSMLAIFMGIYEDLMEAVTRFFDDKKKHFWFLLNFGIGLFGAIVLFSKVILFLLNNYYDATIYLFLGLITGTVFHFRKCLYFNKKNIMLFLIAFLLMFILPFLQSNGLYVFNDNIIDYLYVILLGGIDALTSIVPGISGTAIFMMMGSYEFVLSVLSSPFSFVFLLYGFGVVIGVILTCYLMYYLLKHKKSETNMVIFAFSLVSLLLLFLRVRGSITWFYILIFIIGLFFGYLADK